MALSDLGVPSSRAVTKKVRRRRPQRARVPSTGDLGEALEFMRAIWELDHALNGLSRVMEERLGITGPQRLVIRMVGRMPGVSAGVLAAALHLDPSTLSGHLRRLEKRGVLERRPAKDDLRRVELRLSSLGRRLDVSTPGTIEAAVEDVLEMFDVAELRTTERVLGMLSRAIARQKDQTTRSAGGSTGGSAG